MRKSAKYVACFLTAINSQYFVSINPTQLATATETQTVTIKFAARVGDKPFNCGSSYSGLGKPASSTTPTDFRFYVSDVSLIDTNGKAIPLSLTQDNKWQYQNVALLDFENKSGACVNGTVETRDIVVGTLPKGNYKGLQFTLGVPFNLNHEDATIAPSPLNLTSLWWNWRGGYKFLRLDLSSSQKAKHDTPHNHKGQGFPIHLGSTGCSAEGNIQKPESCSNPNTKKIVFANFNPEKNIVIADIKALLADTNLNMNQANTPVGCMSAPNDGDCGGIMRNLGLPFNGEPSGSQNFFQVK